MHQPKGESPVFTFFVTGDALYSLDDPETQQVWTIILSLSAVQLICDRQELDLRGVTAGQSKMKFPDQVITTNSIGPDGQPSFWNDVVALTRQTKPPQPGTVGWLQYESPYMHRSAWYGIRFLSAALVDRLAIDLMRISTGSISAISGRPRQTQRISGRGSRS